MPNAPTATVIFDRDLRYVSGNEAAFQLLGKSRDELIGQLHLELFPTSEGTIGHLTLLAAQRTLQPQRTRLFSVPLQRLMDVEIFPVGDQLHVVFSAADAAQPATAK